MSNDCGICCSPYTKTARKMVECNNCNYQACSKCVQYYILHTNSEVKCMNCNVAWSMNFLFQNFSKKFCMDYRHHRREILWNKELYHVPIISDFLEHEKEIDRLNDRLSEVRKNILNKKWEYDNIRKKKNKKDMKKKEELQEEIEKFCKTYRDVDAVKGNASWEKLQIRLDFCGGKVQQAKRTNNRPCITEDCKGYVNKDGECPICNKRLCMHCNTPIVNDHHECKQEDIDTFKEISKNTRPCPKCNIRIHKISGCDQMWCVGCNTAFSWTRGTIETGRIHNPHYFDWLFNGGANQGEVMNDNDVCNENDLPHPSRLSNLVANTAIPPSVKEKMKRLYQRLQHIISVEMRRYEVTDVNARTQVFHYLISHIKGNKQISKNYEAFTMKNDLYNEFYTILNNYKRSQIHLFRALFNGSIGHDDFFKQYKYNKIIYSGYMDNFNKFYKKKYKVTL